MKIFYSPEGEDRQEYGFDPDGLTNVEAEELEDIGENQWDTYGQFIVAFYRGSMRAWRAALWLMMRRKNPSMPFGDLKFKAGAIGVDFQDAEVPEGEPEQVGKEEPDASPTDGT